MRPCPPTPGPRPRARIPRASPVLARATAVSWLLIGGPVLAGPTLASPVRTQLPVVSIGIVVDGPWELNEELLGLIRDEILVLTEGEFDVRFPTDKTVVADWTTARIRDAVDALLTDPEVDLLITFGVVASHVLCCGPPPPKPTVAPLVVDVAVQRFPSLETADGEHVSGVPNLTYIAHPDRLFRDLITLQSVVPFSHVAVLLNQALIDAIPALAGGGSGPQVPGVELEFVGVGDSVARALEAIPAATDVVYVTPLQHLPAAEIDRLIDGLIERRLPTFSWLGRREVEQGMLAGTGQESFFPRLARRIALDVQQILLGEDAAGIRVDFPPRGQLVINMATARAIDLSPRWRTLVEAEVLHAEGLDGADLRSLEGTVQEAIVANLDLATRRLEVAAGEQRVAAARSLLLPRVDGAMVGLFVDADRAASSFGSLPQRSLTASVDIGQLIYSDAAHANVTIERNFQEARIQTLERLRLDIAFEAAVTYLNLLRAKTLERIRLNNLELTRSHLETAQIRRDEGVAGPGEVYRWETQISTDRKALIEANADRLVAEIAVNRLLHRDLEEPFDTEEVDLQDEALLSGQGRFHDYTDTPRRYAVFRDFMAREGLAAAPELRQIDAAIAAQERAVTAARRAFWLPTFGLNVGVDRRLGEAGAGTDLPGGGVGFPFAPPNDTSWTVALGGSLPLFTSGERTAARLEVERDLERLRVERDAVAERIEQRIRSALHQARASFAGIELSEQAAAAARDNLDLVADAYSRGAVSILDLLDAQNASLVADELVANAIYDFFIDFIDAERAANRFDFFLGPQERSAWFDRLDRFFSERGVTPGGR